MIKFKRKINIEDYDNVYVVGDIHGSFSLLERALDKINFNKEKDLLIAAGDLVGRGVESHLAIDYLKKNWFMSVVGNHDIIFFDENRDYSQFYSEMDGEELGIYQDEELLERFYKHKDKVSFMIEIMKDDQLLDVVYHAAFPLSNIEKLEERRKELEENNDKSIIREMIWTRSVKHELNNLNYANFELGYERKPIQKTKGVRNIYVGHNVITPPKLLKKKDWEDYLTYGSYKFLDTGAFFVYYIDKFGLPESLENKNYGLTMFNVRENKIELGFFK